jgi:diketogulonate reductase-like aldo/keto reductase
MMASLNNGVEMPMLGLGTWQSGPSVIEDAVLWALEAGYRHIDTAAIYGNEEGVGRAIRKSGVPREEIFVTTKIWNDDHNDPVAALERSLKKLQFDYVDLYLMHWPVPERLETWKILEQLYKEKKCRAIGVSNFTIKHLKELLNRAKVVPAVNQVEFSPYLYQKELHEFCKLNKIQLEAYSPLTRGKKLNDKKLVDIANKYNKTSAQILIQWCLQHDIVVIPKSKTKKRIQENFDVFDFKISSEDIKNLDSFNENLRLCWDPTNTP